jgi:hypothetical protein
VQLEHADFPAPEGPIIKILSVGRDSSDAIDFLIYDRCCHDWFLVNPKGMIEV